MTTDFTINNFNGYAYVSLVAMFILAGSGLVIAFSHYFAKYFLITFIDKAFGKNRSGAGQILFRNHFFHRLAYLVPAFLLSYFSYLFDIDLPHFKLFLSELIRELTRIYMIMGIAFVLAAFLNAVNEHYSNLKIAKYKPINSYVQVAKIVLFSMAVLLSASILFDKSPAYFLTGLGAATAFLALIFKDSITGFIAGIQLTAYDIVRIGDWIEMPSFGADGEVMEISLNTVKVQNFDKTLVTIPSSALLTSGLKNWRGMQESGGRRVKRSMMIDIKSIRFCDQVMLDRIQNQDLHAFSTLDSRTLQDTTNMGLFRKYVETYLRQHPGVHQDMRVMVRQLQASAGGLPLELYFFTNTITSEKYESTQAEIFEYLYAVLPYFELSVPRPVSFE